jgi:dTDP-4-amino-4,6-dideoxygalactose transaminase
MRVPLIDIQAQNASLADELHLAIRSVVESGQFILGPAVQRFERQFADFVGARHCIGLNSGTSALHLALIAAGVEPGDEVITTPLTWISTTWAISYVGARPVFVDVDEATRTIDPNLVARAITRRTKAILPVHLYGRMCDMSLLAEIAQQRGIALIEDAAQAHGARHNGRAAGSFGLASCFSFYPGKNLGACGEAGAVTTSDDEVALRIRQLRDHAQAGRHHHLELGFNYRMEGIQGAALSAKLPRLADWVQRRAELAAEYGKLLANIDTLELPPAAPTGEHAWHLYVVRLKGVDRQHVIQELTDRGISAAIHYPTLVPHQPAYAHLDYARGDFPFAEQIADECLSLPLYPEMTLDQLGYVAFQLQSILAEIDSAKSTRHSELVGVDS